MKLIPLLIILFLPSFILKAQVDTTALGTNLNDVLEDATTDKEGVEYFDVIEYLLQNKIALNKASINDLLMIPFLDRQSATAIIRHRNLLGGINSADQLKEIEGVSSDLIEKILPFLRLDELSERTFFDSLSKTFEGINFSFRSRGIKDIQEEEAYRDNKYDGSNWKFYNRLIISKDRNIRLGVLTEKDPGEKSLNDFTTFHFYAKEIGIIKSFVAGDYLFEFGQGLALWSRYSIRKGTETVRILPRNGKGIIPYLSSDENMFLRGAAALINFNGFNLSSFFSSRLLDGSIDPVTNQITSIRLDGFHRNTNEIAHKRIISEKLVGISADYTLGEFGSFGLLYYNSIYGNDFQKETLLDPSGNRFDYFSTSYNFIANKLTFSGETSYNMKSFATINSAEITIDKNFSLLFSYRNYPKNYWGLHTNGFGEKDGTQNEIGFYSGLKLRTDYGTIYFYYDQFKYPFTSDRIPFASNGNEFLVYYTIRPFANTEIRLRYINQYKDVSAVVRDEYGLIKKKSESIRGELIYKVSKYIQLRSRINLVGVSPSSNSSSEKGFLLFQDAKYYPTPSLNLSARIVFFKTDSYDSRVYEFENDLTGVMTNPPLYGEGTRWYLFAQYKTSFGLILSMKYSELFKPAERTLTSGDTEIQGNIDNRLSFQLDFQF
jgi:hypothetical protein